MDPHHNVQHMPGVYDFPFRLHIENENGKVEDENGIMTCFVEGVNGNMEKMSGKYFTPENLRVRKKECNLYYFVPTTSFPCANNNVIGVGKYLGVPLKEWMIGKNYLWIVDNHNKIMVAGPILGSLIRNVATAILTCHNEGKALGLDFDKIYVEETSFKLSDPFENSEGVASQLRDLTQFKTLVNFVAGASHMTDESLILFNNLFGDTSTYQGLSTRKLLQHSYIICHSPLFWTIRERVNFSNAYDLMHKTFQHNFYRHITLNYDVYSIGDWWEEIITDLANPLYSIYYGSKLGMQNHFLVLFLRICYHHYVSKAQYSLNALDEDIMRKFPLAFSKTYGEIFRKVDLLLAGRNMNEPLRELVSILRKEGLDYCQVGDRSIMEIS